MTLTTLLIAAASFLIGAGIGHLFSRKTDSSEKSVHKLQQKLRQSQDDLKNYQQEVTDIEVPRDYAPSVPGGVLNERYGFEESKAKKSPPDSLADNADSYDDYDDRDPTQRGG